MLKMLYHLPKLSKSGGDEKSSPDTFQKNTLINETLFKKKYFNK